VCAAALQDYLFQYRAGIEAVTPEDVLAAARRRGACPLQTRKALL